MESLKNEQEIMTIIGFGGDARAHFLNSLKEAREGNWTECERLFSEGEKCLNQAHHVQTELIQGEARGEKVEISLLMVHAQDHLMNAFTVKELAAELIKTLKMMDRS